MGMPGWMTFIDEDADETDTQSLDWSSVMTTGGKGNYCKQLEL